MLIQDHETAVDFLNYEAIAGTVVTLLRQSRTRALTIGIHGDWGAGKSSVLKMVEQGMADDERVACLWFNGWAFQGFDDAKTVMIEATITELMRQRTGVGKVKDLGERLIKRIDWLKIARRGTGVAFTLATGLPSPDLLASAAQTLGSLQGRIASMSADDVEAQLASAASLLKPAEERSVPEEIHHFREEFAELLNEAKIDQLVVLIDDLDRCLPSTAIDTLEAIRLFLFVPKTAFVIGADEGMIEYAVREHFPNLPLVSGPIPYARHYLEKLIQVPFRIPVLGVQETRTYVTLLLVEALVGEGDSGFLKLLEGARQSLNQPWLGTGLSQDEVRGVDPSRQAELDAAFFLAQQIGPILAEGAKGNPRQIKRFLNSMFVRMTIAEARGFAASVNQTVLAKLMLAERFQPDFYDMLANGAMHSDDGHVQILLELEATANVVQPILTGEEEADTASQLDGALQKWLDRDWLQRWLKLTPALATTDLRPYVFVAREKRILSVTRELGDLDATIDALGGSEMAARSVETHVKTLPQADAERVFAAVRERAIRHGSFAAMPPGFEGLRIVAKHHPRHQSELLGLLRSVEPKALGVWVVKGWNEILTDPEAVEESKALLTQWANQNENASLKKVAAQALATPAKVRR